MAAFSGEEVVPPALDLSGQAQATVWWVRWAPVAGKLLGLVPPSSWPRGTCQHRPHRALEVPTRTEEAGSADPRRPAQIVLLSQVALGSYEIARVAGLRGGAPGS